MDDGVDSNDEERLQDKGLVSAMYEKMQNDRVWRRTREHIHPWKQKATRKATQT